MKKVNMDTSKSLRRILAATLTIVMALALAVPAFAAEIPTDRPDLEAIAAMYADWDGSYELPDLSGLSEEDQEAVKAMVDAIMLAREAEAQAQAEVPAETGTETDVPLTVSFSDVPTNHTFYKGIIYCASRGIVNGYPDRTFQPAKTVTKSHFCAMLARAFYPDQIEKYDTDWYKKEYGTFGPTNMTLAANGTLNDTSFRWSFNDASAMNTGINRYDMAQLMVNIMKAKGFTATSAQKNAAQSKITDYKNIPSKYQDAVKTVYALGIITGYSDGSFVGTNVMNRGQAAIVIQRMAQYAPVKGDQDNNQYDDGKEKPGTSNPGTGSSSSGSTGTSSGNTGSTGTSSGTGSTGTTTPETKPETPSNTQVLSNGKAITESNVRALINELKAKYPSNTLYAPKGTRISTKIYGGASGRECAGWAALVSDYIFGKDAPVRTHTDFSRVRIGDVFYHADHKWVATDDGCVCAWCKGPALRTTDSGASYKVAWNEVTSAGNPTNLSTTCKHCANGLDTLNGVVIITRYPENCDVPYLSW